MLEYDPKEEALVVNFGRGDEGVWGLMGWGVVELCHSLYLSFCQDKQHYLNCL